MGSLAVTALAAALAAADPAATSDRQVLLALADELGAAPVPAKAVAPRVYTTGFAGYALASEGRADPAFAPAAAARIDRMVDRLLEVNAEPTFGTGYALVANRRMSSSVIWRGHLALILAGRQGLGPLAPDRLRLARALVAGLADDVLDTPGRLLPSYGRRTWPADNEVALAALALWQEPGLDLRKAASAAAELRRALDGWERDGLPASEIHLDRPGRSDVPRGCALSWTVAVRGLHDAEGAAALWRRYRERYWVRIGPVVGLREWPYGTDRKADWDSGPIVLGIGTAASAFGIAAARVVGAEDDRKALTWTARLAGLSAIESRRGGAQMERAIALFGRTVRPW